MKHSMKLFEEPFSLISSGKKTIEVRLSDEKRQQIQLGDEIEFTLMGSSDTVLVKVIGLSKFESFAQLYSHFDNSLFGHPCERSLEEQIASVREVYSVESERAFGVLGIHIELE